MTWLSIIKEVFIDARPDDVWAAVRDFGALHERLSPAWSWIAGSMDPMSGSSRSSMVPRPARFSSASMTRHDDWPTRSPIVLWGSPQQRVGPGLRRGRAPHPLRSDHGSTP